MGKETYNVSHVKTGTCCYGANLDYQVSKLGTGENLTYYFCKSVSEQKQHTFVKYLVFLRRNKPILLTHQDYLC